MIEEIILCLYFSLFIDLNTLFVMIIGYIVITELVNQSQMKNNEKNEKKKDKKKKKRKQKLYKNSQLYKKMNAL